MQVGFLGLGRMGRSMAQNLAKAGHRVRAWNRSAPATVPAGVQLVSSVVEAFQSEVVFTMLSDDAAIRDVVLANEVLLRAPAGLIHVVSSTVSLAFVEELIAQHARARIGYLSAPVFGRPEVAEAGQLNIVAAGATQALAAVQPLLDAIGRKTWVLGQDPRHANAVKIAGNSMIAMAIEAMTEAAAIVGAHGVQADTFLDLMSKTLFGGVVYEGYGAKIARGDFEPGFCMRLGLKDVNLAIAAAEAFGRPLPMLEAVHTRMSAAVASGLGEKDWSALAQYAARVHESRE